MGASWRGVEPLISTKAVAATVFWCVFVGWGLSEWWPIVQERRSPRISGTTDADRGSGAFLIGALYAGMALAFLAAFTVDSAATPGSRWVPFALGLTLIGAGLALRRWAIRTLGSFFTRQVMVQDDHALVTSGPYRVVRHPSYLGGLISNLGLGLVLGNWLSLAAVAVLALVGFTRRIRVEEAVLRAGLGPGVYDAYAAGRARLIPGAW